jgi:hypothetical protein
LLGVVGDQRDELLELAAQSRDGCWIQRHGDLFADELPAAMYLRDTASGVIGYDPGCIPDLLQTAEYSRMLLARQFHSRGGIEVDLPAARDRPTVVDQNGPPARSIYIDEAALSPAVDNNPGVMEEQLTHLMLAMTSGHYRLRVIPTSVAPMGALLRPFRIFRYEAKQVCRPVVHVRSETIDLFLERRSDVEVYRSIATRLAGIALDGEQSLALISALARDGHSQRGNSIRDSLSG